MKTMDVHQDTFMQVNEFELQNFLEDPKFDQFIDLIRGENGDPFCNIDSDLIINGGFVDNQFLSCPGNPFESSSTVVNLYDIPSSTLNSFSCFDGEEVKEGEEEEEEEKDGEDSSATTTNNTAVTSSNTKQRPKTDRSKTLISERRRRGRMKDKLYALRALVPNISKMDKASIVGDAVSYVEGLQAQAKRLKGEIAGLEASLSASDNYQGSLENPIKFQGPHCHPIIRKIMQMDVFQVDDRGFHVKLVCHKAEGVAVSLHRALESLAGFNVQNSNLATVSDRFLLTFNLNVKGSEPEINLSNLKLWLTGALLNQGFDFLTCFPA